MLYSKRIRRITVVFRFIQNPTNWSDSLGPILASGTNLDTRFYCSSSLSNRTGDVQIKIRSIFFLGVQMYNYRMETGFWQNWQHCPSSKYAGSLDWSLFGLLDIRTSASSSGSCP